jgi:hypothetical protein
MWAFWVSFVIFLAEPRQVLEWWPLPTIDHAASPQQPLLAACINLALAMRYEERDLLHRFGRRYADWRGVS